MILSSRHAFQFAERCTPHHTASCLAEHDGLACSCVQRRQVLIANCTHALLPRVLRLNSTEISGWQAPLCFAAATAHEAPAPSAVMSTPQRRESGTAAHATARRLVQRPATVHLLCSERWNLAASPHCSRQWHRQRPRHKVLIIRAVGQSQTRPRQHEAPPVDVGVCCEKV